MEDNEVFHGELLSPAMMGTVFSYLTIFEYLAVSKVCKQWASLCLDESMIPFSCSDFSQLWYLLGNIDHSPVVSILTRFNNVPKYNFSYCHHLTDAKLMPLLEAIPNKGIVRSMHLFYCHKLTDQSIRFIARSFPNLEELNIGSLFDITDKSIQAIAQFGRNIRRLWIDHNEHFTNDILIDLSTMVNLKFVDLQFTKIENKFVVEHRESFPNVAVVGPERTIQDVARPPRAARAGNPQ
uniref:F-box domain-containing protein n=1 Tax=Spongospora subterranea TaxID=70186 RepID=A0A0H5R815_9EUKA|eukprot:CRZ09872.1 hypothetical protein [Spongospora subterranea]